MTLRNVPVQISLLGQLRVSVAGKLLSFPTKKAAALFAFLVMNRGSKVSRERLAGAFWPEIEEEKARQYLSVALWRVRCTLAGSPLSVVADRSAISLAGGGMDVDLINFRSLVAQARNPQGETVRGLLEQAEQMYGGELLEGFSEDVFEEERRVLRAEYGNVLYELGALLIGCGKYGEAAIKLQKLVELDPLNEDAHRELIRAYHLGGRQAAAIAQFSHLKALLEHELGCSPSKPTVDLFDHIRSQARWVISGTDKTTAPNLRGHLAVDEAPLVGRSSEVGLLCGLLDRAISGKGSAAVVYGDLGVGKTKLLQAVMEEARLRGFEVLCAQCPDLDTPPPYQALVQALWPRIQARLGGAATLRRIFDGLSESFPFGSPRRNLVEADLLSIDKALLNEYSFELITTASSHSAPTLFVLDDFHRADNATTDLLLTMLSRLTSFKVLALVSLRRGEREADRLLAAALANGAEAVELRPLKRVDIDKLVEAALGHVVHSARLSEFLHQATAGIPLFMIEMMKFLLSENHLRPRLDGGYFFDIEGLDVGALRFPAKALEAIRRRISRLDKDARRLISIAGVVGSVVPLEVLERLLNKPEDEFIDAVETLLESRLLMDTGADFRFPHESIRAAALGILSETRRRKLHRRVAELLEALAPGKTGEIAWHYSEAGHALQASRYYEAAGDRARLLRANGDAVKSYSLALENARLEAERDPTHLRRVADLLLKRQEVLELSGARNDQASDLDAAFSIAQQMRDNALIARVTLLRSQVLGRMNCNHEALGLANEAERLFRIVGDAHGAALAAESMGLVYVNLRNQRRAKQAFTGALRLFRRVQDRSGEGRALLGLSMAHAFARENANSMECLEAAEEILREQGEQRALAAVLLQKGVLCRWIGQYARSEALLKAGIGLMQQVGDRVGQARGLSQLAYTKAAQGELREGLRQALHAIQLARETGDVRAQILALNNAAYANLTWMGLFRQAERYITRAIQMVREGTSSENLAIYYDTMASIQLEKGDWESALRWGRHALALYRKWRGHFAYVGDEISCHLATAYMKRGELNRALSLLRRAVGNWQRSGDLVSLIHGTSLLAELHLVRGELELALGSARKVEKLLRRVDGLEQAQRVYWIQHKVYTAVGAHAAARRALRKAATTVLQRSAGLTGRFRSRFLTSSETNRDVLATARSQGMGLGMDEVPRAKPSGPDAATRIAQRRKALSRLLERGSFDQSEIAHQLGVSTRTVRSDVAALKRDGLLSGQAES